MNPLRYGMVGWQEFASNRTSILAKYDLAKIQEASRPIKTEHGVAGEAAIREWLTGYLPAKYGVTSGYIIPDVVQTEHYKLYHHDVIIFDRMNAPILWTEANADDTEQGKRRAIPARYVSSVIEVKSALNRKSAVESLAKLRDLNSISLHFPPNYFCLVIFVELPPALVSKGEILNSLLPDPKISGFAGGLVLRSDLNAEMAGEISIYPNDGSPGSLQNNPSLPLAKDIDSLNIYLNEEGGCVIAESGGAVTAFPDGVSKWMISKAYSPISCMNDVCVSISWSANAFSGFSLDLLSRLEGMNPKDTPYRFGQIFDNLERR